MRGKSRFLVVLIVGLGLLTWLGYGVVTRTTRRWFDHDLTLHAQLAAGSGRSAILGRWARRDFAGVTSVLNEISRDERIMAAALCSTAGDRIAATDAFPGSLTCPEIAAARSQTASADEEPWFFSATQRGGALHVSAVPLVGDAEHVGYLVLLHDLSYVETASSSSTRSTASSRRASIVSGRPSCRGRGARS